MANPDQLAILKQGVNVWNEWRKEHLDEKIDLMEAEHRGADLAGAYLFGANLFGANLRGGHFGGADLRGVNLTGADLTGADLAEAKLWEADLQGANFTRANLTRAELAIAYLRVADLRRADLTRANLASANLTKANLTKATLTRARLLEADLTKANLRGANLTRANLAGANLAGADLSEALLVKTHLEHAVLTGCRIYGISAWDVHLDGATQTGLVVTAGDTAKITVDDLEVAQFIYLLSRSQKLQKVINTLGSKGVLIIGRFTKDRLEVLHAIRDEVRKRHDLLPIMFEFAPEAKKTTIETLLTLAHMSRFVIADLTDARAVVQELTKIVDSLRSLPIKLIIHESAAMPSMSDSFLVAESVLKPVYPYPDRDALLKAIGPEIIEPANRKADELEKRLAEVRREYLPWQNTKK